MPADRDPFNEEERYLISQQASSSKPSLLSLEHLIAELQAFNHLAIPSVPFQFRSKLPSASGVYVLYLGADVLYVGQSADIRHRWKNHQVHDKLALASETLASPDLRIGWLVIPKHLLSFVEIYLIGLLYPVLNITHRELRTTVYESY